MPRKKSKSIGVSSLLIQEEPLQVLPSLAVAIGLNEAIFLQQLHYWLRHSKNNRDGKLWVYNTFEEWQEQMPWWSSRTLMRIVDYLRKKGLIETTSKYNQAAIDKTLWYTINYNAVLKLSLPDEPDTTTCHIDDDKLSSPTCQLVLSNMPDCHDLDYDNLSQPITRDYQETTTETTTETTNHPPPPLQDHHSGGGGGEGYANGLAKILNGQPPNSNGHNGHHPPPHTSASPRSPISLSMRTLATDWVADFAAGWASLESDLAGWDDDQVRVLLTWLYVWLIEDAGNNRSISPYERADWTAHYERHYASVYAGVTNRIGLIKSKVKLQITAPLTDDDVVGLDAAIKERSFA